MTIMLRAKARLWVPRHPVHDPVTHDLVRFANGKVYPGQVFAWHGDPDKIPAKAELVDGPAEAEKPKRGRRPAGEGVLRPQSSEHKKGLPAQSDPSIATLGPGVPINPIR